MSPGHSPIGAALERVDGPKKVTGGATYAFEYRVPGVTYAAPVQSTIAKGRITGIDARAALALPGVVALLSHENAPRLHPTGDGELALFQSDRVAYHGQIVAAVVAETLEVARHAAELVVVHYAEEPHDVALSADRGDLAIIPRLSNGRESDTCQGDAEAALAAAAFSLDQTYTTPTEHNHPMEPHATLALWQDGALTLYDANQGPNWIQADVATVFALPPERVRVIAPYVGGGFGSKAYTHPQVILAALAAQVAGRPVKLALTRQQMFTVVGYRTPTIQRIRLGSDQGGRLTATAHDVVQQTSTLNDYAEHTAAATRIMYAAPNRRTTHRNARLDVPSPSIMRAPGECPGMFALESAIDEMATLCGLDPIEFRVRNEPDVDPETGRPFSSRGLVACLREGARRFGWERRDPRPRARQEGRWLVGSGVAASTYPTLIQRSSARIRLDEAGNYSVLIDASDIGTGAWTALTQIAADAFEVPPERVQLQLGDTALPAAAGAGGSWGLASWGSAIIAAAGALRSRLQGEYGGNVPTGGLEASGTVGDDPAVQQRIQQGALLDASDLMIQQFNPGAPPRATHSFGAQFAEVRVDADTGEVRVPRLVGVFAVGRVINAKTGRSQLLGGMTMGLSMALFERSILDPRFGHFANHDFASYHIATHADVGTVDVSWIDEHDPYVNPMGAKGFGELGIVGTAAAVANAVAHATGVRVRDLPITVEKLIAPPP